MKKLSLLVLAALALGACAHSSPTPVAKAVAPVAVVAAPDAGAVATVEPQAPAEEEAAPVEQPTTFSGEHYTFDAPGEGWIRGRTDMAEVALLNRQIRNLTLFLKQDTKLTTVAHRDYLVKMFVDKVPSAVLVPGSKKTTKNNGITFASFVLAAKEGSMKIWVWTTVQKGTSYTLTCGGPEDGDKTQEAACTGFFKSLKITNGQ